jgi:hypothetical protein
MNNLTLPEQIVVQINEILGAAIHAGSSGSSQLGGAIGLF